MTTTELYYLGLVASLDSFGYLYYSNQFNVMFLMPH